MNDDRHLIVVPIRCLSIIKVSGEGMVLKSSKKLRWYHYLLNVDVLAAIIVVLVIVYLVWNKREKDARKEQKKKYKYYGLQDDWREEVEKSSIYKKSRDGDRTESVYNQKKVPQRRINKHEERCRDIFQSIYRVPFKSVRPKWLKNPATGRNLELDGFAPNITTPLGRGLAFEYDGIQHSQTHSHFHSHPKEFEYQYAKDSYKDKVCKEKGVLLVRIPHTIGYEDLETYIVSRLRKLGVYPAPSLFSGGMYS